MCWGVGSGWGWGWGWGWRRRNFLGRQRRPRAQGPGSFFRRVPPARRPDLPHPQGPLHDILPAYRGVIPASRWDSFARRRATDQERECAVGDGPPFLCVCKRRSQGVYSHRYQSLSKAVFTGRRRRVVGGWRGGGRLANGESKARRRRPQKSRKRGGRDKKQHDGEGEKNNPHNRLSVTISTCTRAASGSRRPSSAASPRSARACGSPPAETRRSRPTPSRRPSSPAPAPPASSA
jgi:hypothetical protein